MSEAAALSPGVRKETLFDRRRKGEITLEQLAAEVYRIDQPTRRFRKLSKFLLGLFVPLLFIGRSRDS